MNKKEVVIVSAYARKDVDGTVLSYAVSVKDSKYSNSDSGYIYRYDYGIASFEKTFGFKDESRLNSLVGQKAYINETLSLK